MTDKNSEIKKHFSGKAREGYVDFFNFQLDLFKFSRGMKNKQETFEYLNKIIANLLYDPECLKQLEEEYKIDLQMDDNDNNKPNPEW